MYYVPDVVNDICDIINTGSRVMVTHLSQMKVLKSTMNKVNFRVNNRSLVIKLLKDTQSDYMAISISAYIPNKLEDQKLVHSQEILNLSIHDNPVLLNLLLSLNEETCGKTFIVSKCGYSELNEQHNNQ